ncbi:hypothetical protein D3C73_1516400 [compost metagenome]
MRYREVAFLLQATLLYIPPVVVGAPHHTAGEARFEGHRTWAVVTPQRYPFHTDALGVDFRAGFQPVHYAASPMLAVVTCGQALQAQRLARAGLVDDQR